MKTFLILFLMISGISAFAMTKDETQACMQKQTVKTHILDLSTLLQNIVEPWNSNNVDIEEYYTLRNVEYSGNLLFVGDYLESYSEYAATNCDQLVNAAQTLKQRIEKAHQLMKKADEILGSIYYLHEE